MAWVSLDGGETKFWDGPAGTEPVAKPWDNSNATKAGGNNLTSSQLASHYTPRVLAELKKLGISPDTWYLGGNTQSDYDPAEVQRVGKIYNELGAKNSSLGIGGTLGMMGGDLGPFIAASLAAAGATGGLGGLFGGASAYNPGAVMDAAMGGSGAMGTAGGGGMDWTDVLRDWATGGETASQSVVDLFNNAGMPGYSNYGQSLDDLAAQLFDQAGMPGFDQYGNSASGLDWIKSYLPSGTDASSVSSLFSGKNLGSLLSSGLGAYASNKQTTALEDQAKRYEGYGAPYRQKLSDLYANPDSFLTSKEVQTPVQQGTNTLMRSLSTQGNPFGSGNALQQGQSYASDQLFGKLGQEKDRLAGFGGLSSYNQAAPQAATNAIQSSSNGYNAIGSGLGNIFNPPQTASQTMAEFLKTMRGP